VYLGATVLSGCGSPVLGLKDACGEYTPLPMTAARGRSLRATEELRVQNLRFGSWVQKKRIGRELLQIKRRAGSRPSSQLWTGHDFKSVPITHSNPTCRIACPQHLISNSQFLRQRPLQGRYIQNMHSMGGNTEVYGEVRARPAMLCGRIESSVIYCNGVAHCDIRGLAPDVGQTQKPPASRCSVSD
jgi:hypothetical protein